jgi:colanic acid/amylovoran biosynthesis protein WcaK/AmsJ
VSRPNVLIINGYTWNNKGDSAIVLGMARAIRHHIPDAEITFLTFTPEIDRIHYVHWRIQTHTNVLNPYPIRRTMFQTLLHRGPALGMQLASGLIGRGIVPGSAVDLSLQKYKQADVVVGCGGGYLGGNKLPSLLHLYGLWLGRRFHKPTVLYAHSVTPFRNRALEAATKYVLNRLDFLLCREQLTYKYLQGIGIKSPLRIIPDAAFLMESVSPDRAERMIESYGIPLKDRPLVGITVRNWHFPGIRNKDFQINAYKSAISEFVQFAVQELNARVIFFPQVIFAPYDDDRTVSLEIINSLPQFFRSRVQVILDDLSPPDIKGMIGCMDLFVGTRMHSNIFALSQHVPCVAIAYESKTRGIMEMLGIPEQVINIENISASTLKTIAGEALLNRERKKTDLINRVREIERQALLGGSIIADLLKH